MTTAGLVGARIVCIIIGYVFGMIQTAVFYGRLKGVDIRKVGSGNAGTTNTLRVLGPKAGAVVLLGDMLKCMAAILITYLIFGRSNPEYIILFMAYTAAGTVLGHDFPFFLKFKGGKGIACTAGFTVYLSIQFNILFLIMGLISFFLPFNLFHIVSVCSLFYYSALLVTTIIYGQMGLFFAPQGALIEVYIIVALLTLLAFYQHRGNIKKLINGQERKTYVFKKNKVD
ncbi:glycerol-3-phosphate acyltransferase PlsY [Butyrivibrio sp. Su6]|uniref:glycerol-3-phosphate acyltransferase n=1 Tax=Butyrivibrio sp. Su6 TaxID=1520810 RepID=UPI00089F6241|nr:glycerol-3-phosphate acyltransferase [Butyrivibrio sp. Su6]SEF49452.1 glycerol-3-phosphate acyltransferase PlsY [Butyrivibrio sp. Su6]